MYFFASHRIFVCESEQIFWSEYEANDANKRFLWLYRNMQIWSKQDPYSLRFASKRIQNVAHPGQELVKYGGWWDGSWIFLYEYSSSMPWLQMPPPLPNDILSGPLMVKDDVNAEEGVHEELGMELPDHRICIIYRRLWKKPCFFILFPGPLPHHPLYILQLYIVLHIQKVL